MGRQILRNFLLALPSVTTSRALERKENARESSGCRDLLPEASLNFQNTHRCSFKSLRA